MTRIRVMIVDDEPVARRTLRECCAAEPDLHIVGEFGDPQAALDAIRAEPPQLLFLDIQMPRMSGIELARALDPSTLPLIVFVTAFDHYALEAFEVCAVDYLLKPFDDARFAATLQRVRQRLARDDGGQERRAALDSLLAALEQATGRSASPNLRLLTATHGRQILIDPASVQFAEADRNYVQLHLGTARQQVRATLQQVEQALEGQPILRVSRSCVVNMRYVQEVNRTPRGDFILVLAGGATITSSEGQREHVRKYLDELRI